MKAISWFTRYLIILSITAITAKSNAQYDSIAVAILDSVSDKIGVLETCSFRFDSEFDISNSEYGLITHSESGTVYLKGPDKMCIEKIGDKGNRKFFYDGKTYSLYSLDKNQYASGPATISIIELIDSLSSYYGVEVPGADIFYPDFVDNLLATSNNLVYLGIVKTEGEECLHVAGTTDDITYQFWIRTEMPGLPYKMSLVYINKPENPRYTIRFSDWKLNEEISDSTFEFSAPEGAIKIKLIK